MENGMNNFEIEGTLERMKMIKRGAPLSTLWPSDIDTILNALEKQTQKKPSYYGDEDDGKILCPYCETDLYDDRECGFNNCPYCGQAINWEGAEDNE